MSVVIETTLGDITVDLFLYERPRACLNFLKLCKIKYYNFNLFHTISRGFIAQTGDPTGTRTGGESIFAVIDGPSKKFFEAENEPRIKHTRPGLISFVGGEDNMIASQFFLTLGEDLTYLDEKHCVFGEVVEGIDILEAINEVICDNDDRPFQDVRITHTVVLDDPYPDQKDLRVPSRSPSPSAERLAGGRIAPDEEVDEMSGKSAREVAEMQAEREAKARATILEMVGDIPDADVAPPENVLFVCKLNPVTNDDDLEIIFSRFGKIKSCEVIRDRKSGDSLQYAFIEFEDQKSCEDAYFKMDNVLVDDRRLHVDFSQSVSKVKWLGKGRGVAHFDDRGNKRNADLNNDIGKGQYTVNGSRNKNINKEGIRQQNKSPERVRDRSLSPRRKKLSSSPERSRKRSRSPLLNRRQSRSPIRKRQSKATGRIQSPHRRRKHNWSPDYSPRRNTRRYSPKRFSGPMNYSHNSSRRYIGRFSPERSFGSSKYRSRSPWRTDRSSFQHQRSHLTGRRSRSPRRKSRSPIQTAKLSTRRSSSPEDRARPSKLDRADIPRIEKKFIREHQSRSPVKADVQKTERKEQKRSSRGSRLPRGRSESPEKRSASRRTEGRLSQEKRDDSGSSKEKSESPKRTTCISSKDTVKSSKSLSSKTEKKDRKHEEVEKYKEKSSALIRGGSSRESRHPNERFSLESNIPKEKAGRNYDQKSSSKVKRAKTSSNRSKKSKEYSSDKSSSDSESDEKKSKNKKSKKKGESSTDSSSSEESSSSSEEEVKKKTHRRKSTKDNKKKKSKKRRKSSSSSSESSSDNESDSSSSSSRSSSSSETKGVIHKKKRPKRKRT